MMQFMRILCGMLFAALMTACGGGGGSPGATTGGGTPDGGSTPGASTATASLTASIVGGSGAATTAVTLGGTFSATATVKDKAGLPVRDRLVTFTLSNEAIATLSPETALTDASGVAKVALSAASITARGAATLSASANVDGTVVTGQTDFAVSASNLTLSSITVGNASLASGGNTSVEVTALLNGAASSGVAVNVTFSASCGRINGSTGPFSTATNGSGVAAVTYTAVNADGSLCAGAVTITASSAGADPRSAALTVAPALANAITFVSANPGQIFVAGSGALEQSVVKFKALSGVTPSPNVSVRFTIITNPGGVGLNASGATGDVTVTTDALGEASVTVFSGTIPGPVKVRASLVSDSTVFAETQNLSISSGPPSQRFMSLSVSTFNIEGWNRDGTPTTLTARLADRQGNPVENGTVVNFTSEGGQVASSCSTLKVNGISSCSVDFISQNPRPDGGRVSVLAFASGTKDYTDNNGNNRYDAGVDTLKSIGDAYRDDDEDGVYDAGEFVVPRGGTSACSPASAGWPFPSRASTCDNGLATTVRQQAVILYSSTNPDISITTNTSSYFEFRLFSLHNTLLPMPSGTTVAVEVGDTTENALACVVDKLFGSTVANISPSPTPGESLATTHSVTLKGCAATDRLSIKITVPSGLETTFNVPLQ
ncbi:MAG: hypothetical protein K0Q43_2764 [Ramlibacter sp.]|jgi:hypothetical protein|nr:hypothetical protein [Ramlibacter sp.]